jgi:hypothetical protein
MRVLNNLLKLPGLALKPKQILLFLLLIIANYLPINQWLKDNKNKHTISWQQLLFNILIAFVFFPVMIINMNNAIRSTESIEAAIVKDINFLSLVFKYDIESWCENNINIFNKITNDLDVVNKNSIIKFQIQDKLENIQKIFPQFQKIYIVNNLGELIATSPKQIKLYTNVNQRPDFKKLEKYKSSITTNIVSTSENN